DRAAEHARALRPQHPAARHPAARGRTAAEARPDDARRLLPRNPLDTECTL
ncbi:MAG: hypothetical protein AVDCRST_MAG16-2222, partial [uncultured Frankineae bacterium]